LDRTTEILGGRTVYAYTPHSALWSGGTGSAAYGVTESLEVGGRLEYVRGQNRSLDRPLSSIPPARWILDTEWRTPKLPGVDRTSLRAEVEGSGRQTHPGPLDVPTEPYAVLHLEAALSWQRSYGAVRAGVRLLNLLDAEVRDPLADNLAI